jgi:hypothetical protein
MNSGSSWDTRVGLSADPASVMRHMSVAGERALYVLGSYEGRVTIHSQQIRAFNLAYALGILGELGPSKRMAVVGGGIAGMTFAAAAARRNTSVTIFEQRSELLHLLLGCHTRHLHPNVYNWPAEGALIDETDLPLLNWKADTADGVAQALLTDWNKLKANLGIEVRTGVTAMVRGFGPGGRRVTIISPRLDELTFDIVILATGFGLERTIAPQPLRSYWRDDALHQPELESRDGPTHYLVSGNGDGGLVDILRLRLRDFRHEELLGQVQKAADLSALGETLRTLEERQTAKHCSVPRPSRICIKIIHNCSFPPDSTSISRAALVPIPV